MRVMRLLELLLPISILGREAPASQWLRRHPEASRKVPGILKDVRGGRPHDHLVFNDEDDGRLALARRLQAAPGLPLRPRSRADPVLSEAP